MKYSLIRKYYIDYIFTYYLLVTSNSVMTFEKTKTRVLYYKYFLFLIAL